MSGWAGMRRRLGLLLLVTDAEWATLPLFALVDGLLVAGAVFGFSAANALFSRRVGAASLPLAYVLSAVGMLICTPLVVALTQRLSRRAALWAVYLPLVAALAAIRTSLHVPLAVWALFVVTVMAGGFTFLGFWGITTDLYEPRQARRLFAVIGAGGSLGAVSAGLLAAPLSGRFGTEGLPLVWAACMLATLAVFEASASRVYAAERPAAPSEGSAGPGLEVLREIPLARSLVAITALMVLTSWLIGYQFNVAVTARFPSDAAFATCFAQVDGAISFLALLAQLFVVGRFMARMGVVGSQMAPPVLLLAPGCGMLLGPNLVAATVARGLDQFFQITLLAAATDSATAAVPAAHRDRVLALLRTVVNPLAMAAAGLLLLAATRGGAPAWAGRAVIPLLLVAWLVAAAGVRSRYLATLMRNLASSDGEVQLASLQALEGLTDSAVGDLLRSALQSGREELVVFALQMCREPGLESLAVEVAECLDNPSATVRREAVATLARLAPSQTSSGIWDRLADAEPEVRVAAAKALGRIAGAPEQRALRERVLREAAPLLEREAEPAVRGALLRTLCDAGWPTREVVRWVGDMAGRADERWRVEAAAALPRPLPEEAVEVALALLEDEAASVRRAAGGRLRGPFDASTTATLLRLLRDPQTAEAAMPALASASVTGVAVLKGALRHEDVDTRERICAILGQVGSPDALVALLVALEDAAASVRAQAIHALAGVRVPGGIGDLDGALVSVAQRLVGAAAQLRILGALADDRRVLLLRDGLERDLAEACEGLATLLGLAAGREVGLAARRLLEDALGERERGVALELVDTALRGAARDAVVRVLEAGRAGLATLPVAAVRWQEMSAFELLERLTRGDDAWAARCARWILERYDGEGFATQKVPIRFRPDDEEVPRRMLTLMEKVLFLRQVDLFRDLPGRDLAVIAEGTTEVEFGRGDRIFDEGDAGDALYLVTHGRVAVLKGVGERRKIVAILEERECFGEMAILTDEARSASVEAADAVRALAIRRQSFRDLVVRYPHVAFPIFEILARRLRETTERYHHGIKA